MDEIEKAQIVADAASILILHAITLRSTSAIAVAMNGLIFTLTNKNPELLAEISTDIHLLFETLHTTQKHVQKAGTAQGLFIEDIKDKFGIGGGKPKNVRKGRVRKKD